MPLLLRTPAPHPTESLLGYVLRLSEDNGYDSPWHVLVQAGIHQGEIASPSFPIHKLASVTGRPPSAYESIAYRAPGKAIGYQLLGHHLGDSSVSRPLRLRRPAFCLCCAEESGFIDAFWDLGFAIACPRHRAGLTSACSSCSQRLSWFRSGLLQCKCGSDLRESSRSGANEAVLALMEVLRAKLHGDLPSLSALGSLPSGALVALSLRELVALIRQLGGFALLAASGSSAGSDESIVQAAAESLAEWPRRFHQLLRKLGELPGARMDSPSLVARLGAFYSAMLKGRPERAFLKDEFIQFGAQEWGEGLVDPRMLSAGTDRRFTSRAELARRTGIDPRTLSKWASAGKLSIMEVENSHGKRYVADATELPAKSDAPGYLIEERRAAQLLRLPVAVLAELKGSHYVAAHSPAIKRGYHSADIEAFRLKLSSRISATPPLPMNIPADETITLEAVMRQTRFGGAGKKAAFVGSYLDGGIEGFQVTGGLRTEVVFLRSKVDTFARLGRAASEAISRTDAGKMLACGTKMVDALIADGHIRSSTEFGGRVLKASIDAFLELYVPLPLIAVELGTKTTVLLRQSDELELAILQFTDIPGARAAFVSREQVSQLRESRTQHQKKRRVPPTEALRDYIEELSRSGKRLPRKALVPNKVEIARACGFDRGLFTKNAAISEMLQHADREDRFKFKLSTLESPALRLSQYLSHLAASGLPLPRRGGRPNKLQIARACGIDRNALHGSPEILLLLDAYTDNGSGSAS